MALYLHKLIKWLERRLQLKPIKLLKREIAHIPYGEIQTGRGNIILVGDAAGLCNRLSGGGIRPAIETGVQASQAVKESDEKDKPLAQTYNKLIEHLKIFIKKTHKLSLQLSTDIKREEFIRNELARKFS